MGKIKTQIKQPEYIHPEAEARIRKYGEIRNRLFTLAAVGVISAAGSLYIFSSIKQPEEIKIYQKAQTTVQELQNRREDLNRKLENFSYQNQEVENVRELFNREYNERLFRLDRAIESVEDDISKMESNPEFKQNDGVKTGFVYAFLGGLLTFLGGGIGGVFCDRKKQDLEDKIEKVNREL